MPRAIKGAARNRGRKRLIRAARGYFGTNSRHRYRAELAIVRAGVYARRDRRRRKRDFRRLWITRLTAACRMRGLRYSQFINGAQMAGILLNRKMLSEIAIHDPATFDRLCEMARQAATVTPAHQTLPAATVVV